MINTERLYLQERGYTVDPSLIEATLTYFNASISGLPQSIESIKFPNSFPVSSSVYAISCEQSPKLLSEKSQLTFVGISRSKEKSQPGLSHDIGVDSRQEVREYEYETEWKVCSSFEHKGSPRNRSFCQKDTWLRNEDIREKSWQRKITGEGWQIAVHAFEAFQRACTGKINSKASPLY